MKKWLGIVAAAALVLPLSAKVTGEYVFEGPEVRDSSGNGNDPALPPAADAFVKEGDFAGIRVAVCVLILNSVVKLLKKSVVPTRFRSMRNSGFLPMRLSVSGYFTGLITDRQRPEAGVHGWTGCICFTFPWRC